eukprot:c9294_g1_i1.p1 GENE.c9294_g1_i1~~c9294_g1_i1.p1  ORF type:complete len:378 (+),score=99.58 c9294_g1_i1:55-1134(+)
MVKANTNLNLNSSFSAISLSTFPRPNQGIIIFDSNVSIADAARKLHQHGILSAPVRNADAPQDARWGEKYSGLVDVVSIVQFVVQEAAKGVQSIESFSDALNEMDVFKRTSIAQVVRTAKFGPLMPLESNATLLEAMVVMGKFHVHRIPVVDFESGDIANFLTQSAVVEAINKACDTASELKGMAADMTILDKMNEAKVGRLWIGMSSDEVVKVLIDQPVIAALSLILEEGVGGIAVVDEHNKLVGNISASDVHHMITEPFLFLRVSRSFMSVRDFLQWKIDNSAAAKLKPLVTCTREDSLKHVMSSMVKSRVHRVYVVNASHEVEGVVTLGDVIGALVNENDDHLEQFFALNDERFRS